MQFLCFYSSIFAILEYLSCLLQMLLFTQSGSPESIQFTCDLIPDTLSLHMLLVLLFIIPSQCSFWVFFFVAPCQIVYFSFIVQQLHQLLFVSFFHWTFSLRTLSPFGCVCFLWLPVFCQPLPLSLLTKQTQFNFTPSCPLSVTFKSRYLPKCSCLGHQRYAKIYKQIPISACIFA